jgi:fibronectin type 3 domain-containing protein
VQLAAGSLGAGIGGRLNATTGAHYGIWLYPPDGSAGNKNHIALVKFTPGWTTYTTLTSTTFGIDANWHDLRVEFAAARIRAWVDGTQLIDYTDASPLSGSGITVDRYAPGTISVDSVTMTTPVAFSASGSLVSSAFDAGAGSTWQALSWQATTPTGTSVQLRTRTAATSAGLASATWSAWYPANGAPIPGASNRWMQYQVDLGTTNSAITPSLFDVTATYAGAAQADTTPPVITVPADMTVPATGPSGAVVTYTATATDDVDGALTPSCAPASGSTFPVGTTTVTCTATDSHANSASKTFTVTVTPLVDDPPGVPAGLLANVTSVAVALDWADNTEADLAGYHVYRSASAGGPWSRLTSAPIATSSYTDMSAPTGSTVYYRATAIDRAGQESAPASTSATRTIALRSSSFAQNASTTSLAITTPAGVRSGDIMIAVITVRGAPAITAPSGWTLIRTDASGTALEQATYFRVVDATPAASYAWTLATASPVSGAIVAYSGVDVSGSPVRPVDAAGGRVTSSTSSTSVAGDLLVGVFGSATNPTFTPPNGMVEQGEIATTSGTKKVAIEVADQVPVGAGSTGTRTATASKSAVVIGQLIALRPIGTAPDTQKPTTPTGLIATATSGTRVVVTWVASTDNVLVDHYQIQRATATGAFATVGTSTQPQFTDTSVAKNTTYRYRVVAFDPTGNTSDPSGIASVTTPRR